MPDRLKGADDGGPSRKALLACYAVLERIMQERLNPDYEELRQKRMTQKSLGLKPGPPAGLSDAEWERTLNFFGNSCAYCGVVDVVLIGEHVVPVRAGGTSVAGNIVPACRRCNVSKSWTPLGEWAVGRGATLLLPGAVSRVGQFQEVHHPIPTEP